MTYYSEKITNNKENFESIYFYTLHKCASTLFSSFVLKNINGLQHVDYAAQIYSRKMDAKEILFEKEGYVYGPIRISAGGANQKILVAPTTNHKFIHDKKAIFFVRDPRDILISKYYSFGFSHTFSPVKKTRKFQEKKRKEIVEKTLDTYVLDSISPQVENFKTIYDLAGSCDNSIILKYENMIDDFDNFIINLRKFINIEDDIIQDIYNMTRPKETENISAHRRSGRVGGFREKLNQNTLEQLNEQLAETLSLFEYKI